MQAEKKNKKKDSFRIVMHNVKVENQFFIYN